MSRSAVFVDVTPNMPRICATQIHRTNIPAENVSEYYRRIITLPVLNEVITDLFHRFNPVNIVFIGGFYCIPSLMEKYPNESNKRLKNFMISYVDNMPGIDSCDAEIDCWETFWFSSFKGDDLPDTVETTLQHTMIVMYPNIFAVLILLGIIPVTTCSCERCISVLRRLKTYLPSTMSQYRFNDLAVLQIHYGMTIDVAEILDRLIVKYPKGVKMVNILSD